MEGEDFYTVEQAAKLLNRTPGRIRQMLRANELEGYHEDGDPSRPWRVPQRVVHALREEMPERSSDASPEALRDVESAAELQERVEALQRELGRLEGRLELTERTESTLREQLEREKGRADEAELEARRLRAALEEARKPERPWWRRMFGG